MSAFDRAPWLPYALLAALAGAGHLQVAGFEFVAFDDDHYVYDNPAVRAGLTPAGLLWAFGNFAISNYHPLTWLSHMAGVSLFGTWAGGHHLLNVALHLVNVLLLHAWLATATGRTGPSFFVAAVFAVHPLHVESVAWVSSRKDVLSALFAFAGLIGYARYVARPSRGWMAAVAGLLAASLLSKPTFVTFPFLLLLLDAWPHGRLRWGPFGDDASGVPLRELLWEKRWLFALAAAACVVTLLAQRPSMTPVEALPLHARLADALLAYTSYLGKTFWPVDLAVFYPLWGKISIPRVIAAAGLLALVTRLAWSAASAHPYLLVGWLWFLGSLVPMIGLVQVGENFIADRYMYVPLIGLSIALAWGADAAFDRLRLGTAPRVLVVTSILLVLLGLTVLQVRTWRDSATLFAHALAVHPDNGRAHMNLGLALERRGDLATALQHLERARELRPSDPRTLVGLGNIEAREKRYQRAATLYEQALAMLGGSASAQVHRNLAFVYFQSGRLAEAERHLVEALRIQPGDRDAQRNLDTVRRRMRERRP